MIRPYKLTPLRRRQIKFPAFYAVSACIIKKGCDMVKLLVSACLLGKNCRYNGQAKKNDAVLKFLKESGHTFIEICPECLGGLPTPRPPSEIREGKVFSKTGEDVTAAFRKGAEKALETAKKEACTAAILKERSPSCGYGEIYDGSFRGHIIQGAGVTAALLKENGIILYGESQLDRIPSISPET